MARSSGLSSAAAEGGPAGSSAIPQTGQGTGFVSRTSGSMGQIQTVPGGATVASTEPIASILRRPDAHPSGSPSNFAAQFGWQKWNAFPPWARVAAAFAGSTVIPQTGSVAAFAGRAIGSGRMREA